MKVLFKTNESVFYTEWDILLSLELTNFLLVYNKDYLNDVKDLNDMQPIFHIIRRNGHKYGVYYRYKHYAIIGDKSGYAIAYVNIDDVIDYTEVNIRKLTSLLK